MGDVRKVTVTDCQPARRGDGTVIEGEGEYGPWTLHEIQAVDDTGLPIQERIKCFKALPLGEITLDFTAQNHEKYGLSYTVKPLKGQKLPPVSYANDAVEMVRESVRMLSERVAALENHLGLKLSAPGSDFPVAVEKQPVAGPAVPSDDDIPFAASVL